MTDVRDLEVDLGYAGVAFLFAAGAECCMHYVDNEIHDRCPWHHQFMAERWERRFRTRNHPELKEGQAYIDCQCDYCILVNEMADLRAAIARLA